MILITDVDYKENKANAAGIIIENWLDEKHIAQYTIEHDKIKKYIPGEFFKRELPCIIKLLSIIKEDISCLVIDGYVWLDDFYKRGLGAVIYQEINEKIPIIGVAKKSFYTLGENHRKIYRGNSKQALYITSVGIDLDFAAKKIENMHGKYRIPKHLKEADRLCRDWIG